MLWTAINTGMTNNIVRSFAKSGNTLYAGTQGGGMFTSTNNGNSWTAINNGLTNTTVWTLATSGQNLFAGTNGGGVFLTTNNGNTWTPVNAGLPPTPDVWSLAISGVNIFAGINVGGGVYVTNIESITTNIIENSSNFNEIRIYPNPFSSSSTIKINSTIESETSELRIYDLLGNIVKNIQIISDQEIKLNRDNLPSGAYFLKLTQENKTIATKKLIITD